jgi:hypothetical protein
MITELLAALKAIPRLVDAIERLGEVGTNMVAQKRKDEKDEAVNDIIANAIARHKQRMSGDKTQRISGDSGEESGGDGGSHSNT